jgi:hypothetical protein
VGWFPITMPDPWSIRTNLNVREHENILTLRYIRPQITNNKIFDIFMEIGIKNRIQYRKKNHVGFFFILFSLRNLILIIKSVLNSFELLDFTYTTMSYWHTSACIHTLR